MGWFVGTNIGEEGVVRRQFYEEPLNGACKRAERRDRTMKRRIRRVAALGATIMLMAAGPAYAFGGPNSAGNSGHFHPNSNPCQGPNDQPNCPGPH
jgi:hypothetical protein